MDNELNSNVCAIPDDVNFSEMEMSAVAEIENISMGSAATAISNLLSEKVLITTPKIKILKSDDICHPNLEPSVQINIEYIKGVKGTNTMVLKQSDCQVILNKLMGQPVEIRDDFEFDELNISAMCEVMNQMMGSAATAVSEFLNIPIDISTPQATVHDTDNPYDFKSEEENGYVAEIHFNLSIGDIVNSEFISVISVDLAKTLASTMLEGLSQDNSKSEQKAEAVQAPDFEMPADIENAMNSMNTQQNTGSQPLPPAPQMEQQQYQQPINQQPMYQQMPQQPMYQQQMPQQPMYQQMPQQPMYQQQYQQPMYQQQPVNVKSVQLHQFAVPEGQAQQLTGEQQDNLNLLMGVPLDISIELGKASKKVKEILEFTQGTIIELDKQAGAPVDIIVNGHLIARGDVVVIDDNFAVRVTEIVKSKFLDSLGSKE